MNSPSTVTRSLCAVMTSRLFEAEQVRVRPAVALLILHGLTGQCVVVLLHKFTFADVIRSPFRTRDQETVEARPVIDLP